MKRIIILILCLSLCLSFSGNVFVKGSSFDHPENLVDKSGVIRKLFWRDEFTGTKLDEKNYTNYFLYFTLILCCDNNILNILGQINCL